jgi:hypothetical protein
VERKSFEDNVIRAGGSLKAYVRLNHRIKGILQFLQAEVLRLGQAFACDKIMYAQSFRYLSGRHLSVFHDFRFKNKPYLSGYEV